MWSMPSKNCSAYNFHNSGVSEISVASRLLLPVNTVSCIYSNIKYNFICFEGDKYVYIMAKKNYYFQKTIKKTKLENIEK